jgi:hypothetical membrane protein
MSRHDISFLGITSCGPFTLPQSSQTFDVCSPLHDVYNTAIVLFGLLTIAGAILTRPAWPPGRLASIGIALVILGAIGAILAGLFTADQDLGMHAAGALLHFVLTSVGTVLLGVAVLDRRTSLGAFSIACGAISLTAFILYGSQIDLGLGRGGMARLASYPCTLWLVVTGATLLMLRNRRLDQTLRSGDAVASRIARHTR